MVATAGVVKPSTQLAGIADLALIAPVKAGFVPGAEGFSYHARLQALLRTLNAIRSAGREAPLHATPFPDSVGRFGILHSFRYALIPPDIDKPGANPLATGPYRLFLSVTFDGGWEPYLRVIYRDLGPLLDTLFCNCEDYPASTRHSFDDYMRWVRRQEVGAGILFTESAATVMDQRYHEAVERLQLASPSPEEAVQRIAGFALPAPADAKAALTQLAQSSKAVQAEVIANNLRALKGLYDLRAAYPHNAEGDDAVLLTFAQRAMPELRAWLQIQQQLGNPSLPPDNRASADWLKLPEPQPPAPPDRSAVCRREDLQAGLVNRYPSTTHGALFLLGVADAAAARSFIARLPLTNDAQLDQPLPPGHLFWSVAFTRQGLQAIGACPDETSLARFPQEFIDGMESRAGLLGDVRGNHPDQWRRPKLHHAGGVELELRSVHLVVQVRLADGSETHPGAALHPVLAAERDRLAATDGLLLLATEPMRSWPQANGDVREHFGYRDGLSQPSPALAGAAPAIPAAPAPPPPWSDQVPLGDLLLGHPTSRGGRVYPPREDVLLDNGSFLVLRKIRQHQDRWLRLLQRAARQLDLHFEQRPAAEQAACTARIAAKLMGRSFDGAPAADPGAGSGNGFDYTRDTLGSACPFAAHVRRANPRTRSPAGAPNVPRLLRRGMSYGDRLRREAAAKDSERADADRGLFFMAYCGSLAEQFEVVQRWMAGGNSTGVASSQSDPFLGVPQAGQPRWFQWLDDRGDSGQPGQAQRIDVGDEALTSLQWGLYLFVPSIPALQAIAAGSAGQRLPPAPVPAPAARTFREWQQLVQDADPDRRDALWRYVRENGGSLDTPYGRLVGSAAQALPILQDGGQRYSVRGYGLRFADSVGKGYLGMDVAGPDPEYSGHDQRAEHSGINAAIVAIDERKAFDAARSLTRARLSELLADTPATVPQVTVDLLDLGEQVLGKLVERWFGVDLPPGGMASEPAEPPRCPRDFVNVARYIFGPHPSAEVAAQGRRRGQALRNAVLATLQRHSTTLPDPLPELSRAIYTGLNKQQLDLGVVADTITGVILGFTPSVFGNYTNLMRAWVDRGSDPVPTLWDLQARLHAAGSSEHAVVQAQLRPLLIATMRRAPIPTFVWREAVVAGHGAKSRGDGSAPAAAALPVVVGLHGVAQDEAANGPSPELLMFGGAWSGGTKANGGQTGPADPGCTDLRTPHACPGWGLAVGVLLGIVSELVWQRSLKVSPSPTIVYWVKPAG